MFNFRDTKNVIMIIVFILLLTGLLFTYSTGQPQAIIHNKPEYYYFFKQFIAAVIGICGIYVAYHIPLDFYKKHIGKIYFLVIFLLTLVFFFRPINFSHRWIILPHFNFQPSELAKFTAIVYIAHYLDKKNDKLMDFKTGLLPVSLMVGIMAALILAEPDFGTTFLIVLICLSMFFVGGINLAHLLGGIILLIPVGIVFLNMGYRKVRLISFLNPWKYEFGEGFQLIQSFTAVASGGLFGKGLGNSSQKLLFLPEAHTDFVYAIIAEELGIWGPLIILGLMAYLFYIGLKITFKHQNDKYKRLLTFGLSLILFLQAIMHIYVTLGLMPTKGITLPFISYGGSALVVQMFMIGVLLRSAKEAEDG
jgi:cell division protein FtsW